MLSQRLKTLHERSMAIPGGLEWDGGRIPGGIAGVAVALGVTRHTLGNWFAGHTKPTIDALEKLSMTLEVLERRAEAKRESDAKRLEAIGI